MINTNCLAGIRCPSCGNEDRLKIVARIMCLVTDDGSEPVGDHDWDDESFAVCPECEKDGPLAEFYVDPPPRRQPQLPSGLHTELAAALRTVVEIEHDRDEESRNFDEERLEYFAGLVERAEGRAA